ncbi:MAG: HypC/HybG/HupF family hydrogenase formation chaperone [Chloroflexi bacterium]|nr:HypC/HybG/HupF family hydrogenase formation chaperone [Chloroflexota bacterium]
MCLAVPVRVEAINNGMGMVEFGGVRREVSLALTPEARAGDYVLIHTGYAISVLDAGEAEETLRLFDELTAAAEAEEAADQRPAGEGSTDNKVSAA